VRLVAAFVTTTGPDEVAALRDRLGAEARTGWAAGRGVRGRRRI